MVKKIFWFITLDQITKLVLADRDFFVAGIKVHLVRNYGLSFGINLGNNINTMLIISILVLFIWYWVVKRDKINSVSQLSVALIVAGGISNLGDRIFLGFVRDFFDFGLGFTANLADLYVVLGLILIIFFESRQSRSKQASG